LETKNKPLIVFICTRTWITLLILSLVGGVPRAWGEDPVKTWSEDFQKKDLTLTQKGIIVSLLCGWLYYDYEKQRERWEGGGIITDVQVDGERREQRVDPTPYIIAGSVFIGWFLSEAWSYLRQSPRDREEKKDLRGRQ